MEFHLDAFMVFLEAPYELLKTAINFAHMICGSPFSSGLVGHWPLWEKKTEAASWVPIAVSMTESTRWFQL